MPTLRTILAYAIPSVAGVFGILWFLVRRKPPRIKESEDTDSSYVKNENDYSNENSHGVKRHQCDSKHGPYVDAKQAKMELQKRREEMNQQCDIDPKQAKFESGDNAVMPPIIEEDVMTVSTSEPILQSASSDTLSKPAFDPSTVRTQWTENFIEKEEVNSMFSKLSISEEDGTGDSSNVLPEIRSHSFSETKAELSNQDQAEFVAAYVQEIVQNAVLDKSNSDMETSCSTGECTKTDNCNSPSSKTDPSTCENIIHVTGELSGDSSEIILEPSHKSREVIDLSVESEVIDLTGGDNNDTEAVIDLIDDSTNEQPSTVVKSENCTESHKFAKVSNSIDSKENCPTDQNRIGAEVSTKSECTDNSNSVQDSAHSESGSMSKTPVKERQGNHCADQSGNSVINVDAICDDASEASNDSGKGASFTENISPPAPGDREVVELSFPSDLCGRLIGKHGKNINYIKENSGANLTLRANPYTVDFQICTVDGSPSEIERAMELIQQKFPPSKFPTVDLTPIGQSPSNSAVLMPDIMQLNLPEGVSVDSVVSSIVDAGHVFIQQPTHPTFPSLERLNQFMLACYTQDGSVPPLPRPLEAGVICSAPMLNGWYRAQVITSYEDTEECDIKYVDYGGFSRVQSSLLRQIRSDFMTLPFQAVECYMANITTLQDEEYFSAEAAAVLEELTQGKLLQAQVVGRTDDGTPYVHIYQINGNKALFVNRELVNRGVTRWVEILS